MPQHRRKCLDHLKSMLYFAIGIMTFDKCGNITLYPKAKMT